MPLNLTAQQSQFLSSIQANQIAFSSTTERFMPHKNKANAHIGPGSYESSKLLLSKKIAQPKQQ